METVSSKDEIEFKDFDQLLKKTQEFAKSKKIKQKDIKEAIKIVRH